MKKKLIGAEARSGYIDDFGFNPNWKKQRCICGYEHCIELMPLPGITRREAIDHNNYFKRCLETGILGTGEPLDEHRKKYFEGEIKGFNSLDYPIKVDRSKSCPVFGHNCPGGKAMIAKCNKTIDEIPNYRFSDK